MDPYTQNPTSQKIGKYGAHPHVSISIRVHNPVERLASATPGLLTLTAARGKDFSVLISCSKNSSSEVKATGF
jgi:hypothetical protein